MTEQEFKTTLGRNIQTLRQASNLIRKDLIRILKEKYNYNISERSITMKERGERPISAYEIYMIYHIFSESNHLTPKSLEEFITVPLNS